ncbi:MAG TPA: alpha/beta fold hydrolase [Saprospiraceae bacterium]|nr:alpha/beta fold hydrolase [Saprospiraceae bacterium]
MTSIALVIGSYGLICVLFYFFQHYFFFRPELLPQSFQYQYPFPFEEVKFTMEDGGTVNGVHFKMPNALGVVFYLKGNSRSIKGWGKFAKDFLGKGYDFFMIDYRGFGKSRGKRSESILYSDAQHLYKWLSKQYPENQIILYGRSYGSGIATRIASWNNPRMLILDSPYYSFWHLTRRYGFWLPLRWVLRYKIRTDQFMAKVECPVYLIHGTRDRLIPYAMSVRLAKEFPRAVLVSIPGAKHNNLPAYSAYHDVLYALLNDEQPDASSLAAIVEQAEPAVS